MIEKRLLTLAILAATSVALCGCTEQTTEKRVREYDAMIMHPTSRKLSSVYSATIRGKQDIDIRPKVSGYITDIYVKEGSVVTKGQTLFVIDQIPYQTELQTAIANVDVAKAAVDAAELTTTSKEALFEQNIISEFDLNMARTTLASQRAQLAQARANEVTCHTRWSRVRPTESSERCRSVSELS